MPEQIMTTYYLGSDRFFEMLVFVTVTPEPDWPTVSNF